MLMCDCWFVMQLFSIIHRSLKLKRICLSSGMMWLVLKMMWISCWMSRSFRIREYSTWRRIQTNYRQISFWFSRMFKVCPCFCQLKIFSSPHGSQIGTWLEQVDNDTEDIRFKQSDFYKTNLVYFSLWQCICQRMETLQNSWFLWLAVICLSWLLVETKRSLLISWTFICFQNARQSC